MTALLSPATAYVPPDTAYSVGDSAWFAQAVYASTAPYSEPGPQYYAERFWIAAGLAVCAICVYAWLMRRRQT